MNMYWVDLPDPQSPVEDCYVCVDVVHTKQEALDKLWNGWGIPAHIAEFFITEGDDAQSS